MKTTHGLAFFAFRFNCKALRSPGSLALRLALLLTALHFTVGVAAAQTQVFPEWSATLKGFIPAAIAADSKGNVYLVGTFESAGIGEMLAIGYDSSGHLLWKNWLGTTSQNTQGFDIGVDSAGNVYALGSLNEEFVTAKYNSSGVRQWADYYRVPGSFIQPVNIAVKPDGSFFISGTSTDSNTGGSKALLIAYSTGGTQLWTHFEFVPSSLDGFPRGVSAGVAADPQGNAVLGIYFADNNQAYFSGIRKFDANGKLLANDAGGRLAQLTDLKLDSHGNWYVAGTGDIFDLTGNAYSIAGKYDPNGNVIWFDDLAISSVVQTLFPIHIVPNADGSVFLSPVPGDSSNTLGKFSSTGVRLWTVQDSGLIASNSLGDVYVAADHLSKYDPNGILIWQRPFTSSSNQPASATALTLSGGDTLVAGTFPADSIPTSSLTVSYVQDAAKLTPSTLTFSRQPRNTTSPAQVVTLKNTSEQSLSLESIISDGDFHQTNHCPATLAPGASCSVSVTFTPSAAGTRTGTLTVTDPWAGSPQTVKLTGTGT